MAEGQAGGACGVDPEDLEGVAREAELGEAEGQPDRDLDLLEEVEGQVAHHGAEDAEEAGVGSCDCAEALQKVAGETEATFSFHNFWDLLLLLLQLATISSSTDPLIPLF